MIEETSLQLYVSALAHCPESCYVRKYFEHNIPKSIIRLPTVSKEWGSLQQTHHDDGDPEDICLSPDGKLVANLHLPLYEFGRPRQARYSKISIHPGDASWLNSPSMGNISFACYRTQL